MPIITDGLTMAPEDKGIDEFHSGFWEARGTSIAQSVADSSAASLAHFVTDPVDSENKFPSQTDALGNIVDNTGPGISEDVKPAIPRVDIIDANDRVKKAGLAPFLKLPDQPDIPPAQLDIMMSRARARREREATIERGPQGFVPSATDVATSFLVGAVDPVNMAAAFIPVMGELRYGKLLADAGESAASRFAVRASVGAAQGAVGQAALEPLDWWSHTQDGRDFGMADVLHNLMFGAALGGALHAGGGAISDVVRRRQGLPVYPFGPGEPMENVQGTHLPAALLHEDGITPEALEQHFGAETPEIAAELATPQRVPLRDPVIEPESIGQSIEATAASDLTPSPEVQTINDLPARAHEDAMRGAIASLIEGEPVRAGEMLEAAAQTDPRIAESFEAFHGSPHDFDRFDIGRIGSGEGAQAYGRGLYFAEEEAVARNYRTALSIKGYDSGRPFGSLDDNATYVAAGMIDKLGGRDAALAQAVSKAKDVPDPFNDRVAEILRSDAHIPPLYSGSLYKVRISADRDHFLDWDKPISEQSPQVRAALAKFGIDASNTINGMEAYRELARQNLRYGEPDANGFRRDIGPVEASRMLQEAGVPGVKYLDAGSRGDGEGTRNFVVFNDKDIEITHKNGEPVYRENFLADRAAEREGIKTTHVAPKAARGRAAADPKSWSLFEFLAHEGGLKPDPELEAILGNKRGPFVPGFGALIRAKGRPLDDALRLAKDHGYMFDAADVTGVEGTLTPRDLLDRIAEERAGRKQYRMDQHVERKVDAGREAHEIVSHLRDEIEAVTGMKDVHLDPAIEQRVVEIFTREGERDVLNAYERAIMEAEERYDAATEARRADERDRVYPGWDTPDVAGAAPAGGGASAVDRGSAGSAGPRPGGDAGDVARAAGADDRAAPEAALDRDAAWRSLAQRTPDFDDPDLIAASNEAAAVRQPPTKLDDRVAAAEKANAFAKQMYDMFADRMPPEDRQRLDDLLKKIDDDHEAREIAIVRGGSCLFGVV